LGSRQSNRSAKDAAAHNGTQEDADALLQTKTGFVLPMYSVLYSTLSTEKYDCLLRFAAARVCLDFIQLLLLVLRPEYGFQFNTDLWVWNAIKWVEFANPLTSESYEFYVVWIYVGVAILVSAMGVALWVSWCFKSNHFPYIWPVMLLRMVVNAAVFLFYVSCFTVFLAAFNCNWFMEGQGEIQTAEGTTEIVDLRFRMNRFPEVQCFELPHLAHGIVALVACIVFTMVAYAVTLTDYEPNPASRRWMATPHPSVEVWALATKTIMALNMAIFAGQLYIQSVIMCLATLFLCYLFIRWQPHLNEWVNHIRSGLYCMLFWASIFIAIMKFDHRRDNPGHSEWLTDIMLMGLAPVLVFGVALSFARLRLSTYNILKTIRKAPEGMRIKDLYWFSTPEEVEIASRVLRRWMPEDDEVLDPEAVQMADLIIQIGLAHFPEHPRMINTQANFLISIQHNYQMGPSLLQHITKLEDSTQADHYAVFAREQELKERSKEQNQGVGLSDLVGYVEFQRNFRMLARAYRASLMTLKAFWTALLHEDIEFKRLVDAFAKIEASAKRTDKVFKVLLERYPNNENLYRMYARFLEHVRSDPWTANKYTLAADKLEEEQDKSGGLALSQEQGVASSIGNVSEKNQAILVIDAAGILLVANKQAQKLFGYKKTEMEGKNVSMLMPQPFAGRHNGYLRTHLNSGKIRILDLVRPVVGLHKDRTVFPINLGVTKVSGVGSDSVFMGAMHAATAPPNVIRVWCMPTGGVVSVDDTFSESFGKTYKDVAGRPFQSLTRDPDVILKLLDRAAAARESDFLEGKIQQKGIFVLHNYMDPVEVDVLVGMGGSESQRMLCFDLRLAHSQGMLMVADARGRLLYMNSEMRHILGISDDTNVSKLDMNSLMPPPFSLLHGKWMKEAGTKVPKQSCRSGATVVMLGANKAPLPIRPKIMTREVEDSEQHLVQVEMSSWERGMDERQLVLTLDTHGNIIATNKALTSLFGFRVEELVGRSVACIVDVLAQLRDELESVLARMAEKIASKPGYSWRVGVHPPVDKPLDQLTLMEVLVMQRSTQAAIMMLELKEAAQEDQLPEIKLHIYKADMLNCIIEVDQFGLITRPSLSPLDPSGYMFGCNVRSMQRRPLKHFLQLPGKGPDSLLQNDKVKGAMKKGTGTGSKVGPMKVLPGIHADGSPMSLNVLAVTLNGKHIVAKCSFERLEKGDVERFRGTLRSGDVAGAKSGRRMRGSSMAGYAFGEEDAKALALAVGGTLQGDVGTEQASAAALKPVAKKGVKFAGSLEDDISSASISSGGQSQDEDALLEEEEEEVPLQALEASSEDEEEEDDAQTQAAQSMMETDWGRGRRLKALYTMLNSEKAKQSQTRYIKHTNWMLFLLVAVHTLLFALWISFVTDLNKNVEDLDSNGGLIFDAEAIQIQCRKIHNMYHGTNTNERVYMMSEKEMQITEKRLKASIDDMERLAAGVYLGFTELRRLRDDFQLRDLWEGDMVEEELYLDTRVPKVQEEPSNLWLVGNQLIASAREVLHNHELIAAETGNDFRLDKDWQYVMSNVPHLASQYTVSLSALLQRDFQTLSELSEMGWGFMIVELVVCAAVIVWSFILLKGVSQVRHSLVAVFLTIPTGLLRALAERQVKMADEDAEGNGDEDDEDEEQQQQQHAKGALPPVVTHAAQPTVRTSLDNSKAAASKTVVVDLKAAAESRGQLPDMPPSLLGQISNTLKAWSRRLSSKMHMLQVSDRFSEKPIMVGKRRLKRYRRDIIIMLLPLVIWFVLLLVIYIVSVESQKELRRPMVNNYLADRLHARTTRAIADAHELASLEDTEEISSFIELHESMAASLEHIYDALLYGHEENKRDMDFISLDGTLFDGKETEDLFFHPDPTCHVKYQPERYCYEPGHPYYQVTHNAIDAMMQRLFDELHALMATDPEEIAKDGVGGAQMEYIWNVGFYNLAGAQEDASEFYSHQLEKATVEVLNAMIALFAIMWVLLAAYYYFLFNPFKHHLQHELRQVSEMLSHMPADMAVEATVAKAVGLEDHLLNAGAKGGRPVGK